MLCHTQLAMAASSIDQVADACPASVRQGCSKSPSIYPLQRVGECTSTWYSCTPEYSWAFTGPGISRPPIDDPMVSYPGCSTFSRPDYMVTNTDYAYLPTPTGAVYGCATMGVAPASLGVQTSNTWLPGTGGCTFNNACPPQHTPFPEASDDVFQPAHFSAPVSYMQPSCVPAYSPRHTDVRALYAGSQDQNGYRDPIYVSSGSNGLTKAEVSEMLPQPDNHSPVHTEPHVSYDIPKFKLTQERALPLVHWFEEHQDHPYPSRQEKLNLCQATQLTYTQVSTWFANARRRSKKREMSLNCTSSDEGEI